MTKAEIIEGMLNLLNSPDRWCKGLLYDGNNAYCLVGAMFMVSTGYWNWGMERQNPEILALARILSNMAREKGYTRYSDALSPIAEFNNAAETGYEDMRLFLKEALEKVEGETWRPGTLVRHAWAG